MIINRFKLFRFCQIFIDGIELITKLQQLTKIISISSLVVVEINTLTNSRIYYPLKKRFELIEIKKFTMAQ